MVAEREAPAETTHSSPSFDTDTSATTNFGVDAPDDFWPLTRTASS